MDELTLDDLLEKYYADYEPTDLVHRDDPPLQPLTWRVEPPGSTRAKPLLRGERMLLLYAERDAGSYDPPHVHPDHESLSYLLEGEVDVEIDGETYDATPGAAYYHGPGVVHSARARTDCAKLEIKHVPEDRVD
ncbi:cupin domain-containing protein [Halovivax limisalsi]|uniref:cupin domain-containing protein n=1 Tax=Halovivax limisalsi TaxID=1453760 RepID=UPI001FFDC25F|nr:cupin domain-containing protein [Halovivax limisalsi]